MKKQTILAIAALLVFGVGNATFAYVNTTGTSISCACCKGDSCPMKKKDASGKAVSCCDDCDCCSGDKERNRVSNARTKKAVTARAVAKQRTTNP